MWIREDYKGNKQVWYSERYIKDFKKKLKEACLGTVLRTTEAKAFRIEIVRIIKESEEQECI